MTTQPSDLVRFGDRFVLPEQEGRAQRTVTLRAVAGPSIELPWGMLAIADPWFPEVSPEFPAVLLGKGEWPTTLSTIDVPRGSGTEPQPMACAASIGRLADVATWQPVVQAEEHFHLDCDSGLGAFYDITDAALLQEVFEDDAQMKRLFDAALAEQVVTMEVQGRVAAVVFEIPDGPDEYAAWVGFDRDGQGVAALVDLKILDGAQPVEQGR